MRPSETRQAGDPLDEHGAPDPGSAISLARSRCGGRGAGAARGVRRRRSAGGHRDGLRERHGDDGEGRGELEERGIVHEMRVMSAHREPDVVAEYAKNARITRPARDHRRRRHLRRAARRRRRAHRPAGDRRAAVRAPDRRRRTRRDPLDRADAPGRAGRVRRPRQRRATPRSSRADPRRCDPRYTRAELGRLWTDEARMERWRRVEVAACEELPELLGAGPQRGRARRDPRGDVHRRGGQRARAHDRSRHRRVRRRARASPPARPGAGSTSG